jgi:hypothetical protein
LWFMFHYEILQIELLQTHVISDSSIIATLYAMTLVTVQMGRAHIWNKIRCLLLISVVYRVFEAIHYGHQTQSVQPDSMKLMTCHLSFPYDHYSHNPNGCLQLHFLLSSKSLLPSVCATTFFLTVFFFKIKYIFFCWNYLFDTRTLFGTFSDFISMKNGVCSQCIADESNGIFQMQVSRWYILTYIG